MNPCFAAALDYARAGLHVFPALRGSKLPLKSARRYGTRWGATTDAVQLERDWSRWPDANVCISCGAISQIFVLDIDVKNGIDGTQTLALLTDRFGEALPSTWQAQSPSGSLHYYFQWPKDRTIIRNATGMLGRDKTPGIDVRGNGGMVVAPPSQIGDSNYRWLQKPDTIAEAPAWLLALIAVPDLPAAPSHHDNTTVYPALVAETVKHIPTELNWHDRNRVGMAIWVATYGSWDGFAIWDQWLRRSGKYNGATARQRWAAMARSQPNNIGYGSLLWRASQASPQWADELDMRLMRKINEPLSTPTGGASDDLGSTAARASHDGQCHLIHEQSTESTMRPRYETPEQRAAQLAVANRLLPIWEKEFGEPLHVHTLPSSMNIKFAILSADNKIRRFLQVKCRNLSFGFGDGYYISSIKTNAASELRKKHKVSCWLAVQFVDGVIRYCADFDQKTFGIVKGGRTDRNDPQDREVEVIIPWDQWDQLYEMAA